MPRLAGYNMPYPLAQGVPKDLNVNCRGPGFVMHVIPTAPPVTTDWLEFQERHDSSVVGPRIHLTEMENGSCAAPLMIPFTDGVQVHGVVASASRARVIVAYPMPAPVN